MLQQNEACRAFVRRATLPMLDATTSLADLEGRLRAALARPLPGLEAHSLLAPRPRPGWRPWHPAATSRPAAALVLLYSMPQGPGILLTMRAARLPSHAGQISLPGGAVESGEAVEDAALRESREEIGLDPRTVRVLGRLTPLHIPVSGFVLHPVVGVTDHPPGLSPAHAEVQRVIEAPLSVLSAPANVRRERRCHDGLDIDVPYFVVDDAEVWGATAMVLAEFLVILGVAICLPPVPAT